LKPTDPFTDWPSLFSWDLRRAAARLDQYKPTPMDLEIEFQEEVFLPEWRPLDQRPTGDGHDALTIESSHLPFEIRLDRGPSGIPLRDVMKRLTAKKNKTRPPLYGLVHYESCRLILQPLSVLAKDGIDYLTISQDKVSQAELVKAMKFT
jgi:hypothetical protein